MVKRLLTIALALGGLLALSAPAYGAFGLQSAGVSAVNRDESPDVQAGSHPYALTTSFLIDEPEATEGGKVLPSGTLKDAHVELPAGFVGDPTAVPKCTAREFAEFNRREEGPNCPDDTAVGYAVTYLTLGSEVYPVTDPIYNVQAPAGTPAELAYKVINIIAVHLETSIRGNGDYGLTVDARNIPNPAAVYGTKVVIWGVPSESSHDSLRGQCIDAEFGEEAETSFGNCHVSVPDLPFLTNPTSCGVARTATISVDDWENPGVFFSKSVSMPELSGCEKLPFDPTLSVQPDGSQASTPTGLSVDLHVPQEATTNPAGLAEADVKNTTVTLPEGLTLNPSAADGLSSCSEAQVGLHSGEASSCPVESKVGTVEIDTPLLPEPLAGSVYLAQQGQNPFGSLVALYVVGESKTYGVRIKLAGQVGLDPASGQLTATFMKTPQLPFGDFKLHFFGTARAPLSTPGACGSYATQSAIEPWSGGAAAHPSASFQILAGPGGGPCPSASAFAASLTAGSTNVQAGAFSPFTMTMSREDGQQPLGSVQLRLPAGLLGMVSSVPRCGEAQADAGSCDPASQIGQAIVSVGLGNDPYTVAGGRVYLTGPYEGAPYGLSIVVPAKAGPFDLGQVVVRARIEVDPLTAALTVTTDSTGPYRIPTILDGIPLQLKRVNVTIDRPGFTFNPTDCDPLSLTGAVASAQGLVQTLTAPFQVTDCAALGFGPSLAASTSGKTSRSQGASLHVKLTYPRAAFGSQANIHSVRVELPKALPSRLSTLNQACPDSVFDRGPAGCSSQSRVGFARAITPVLGVPLEGPAYFVSHGGQKFPELIVVLQGGGVTIDLAGETFISKAGITSSTFKSVPDVPVSSFELTLPQGPYSALAANRDLCAASLAMPTVFDAQDGARVEQDTPIEVEGCPYALKILARRVHKRTLTLLVAVPAAGRLVASGRGVFKAAKSSKGRQTLTLTLKERQAGRLRTRIALRFVAGGAGARQSNASAKALSKGLIAVFP